MTVAVQEPVCGRRVIVRGRDGHGVRSHRGGIRDVEGAGGRAAHAARRGDAGQADRARIRRRDISHGEGGHGAIRVRGADVTRRRRPDEDLDRRGAGCTHRLVAACQDRVAAQPVEGIRRVAVPLDGRIEHVVAIRVPRGDGGLATQRVVGRAGEAGTPFGARVEADLADGVHDRAVVDEKHGVIAVEPAGGRVGLVRLRQDRGVGRCLRDHKYIPRRDGAGQRNAVAHRHVPVEMHLDGIAAGGQIDRVVGRVVDLERLVEARALHVLAEEELTAGGCVDRGDRRNGAEEQRQRGHRAEGTAITRGDRGEHERHSLLLQDGNEQPSRLPGCPYLTGVRRPRVRGSRALAVAIRCAGAPASERRLQEPGLARQEVGGAGRDPPR